MTPGRPSLEVRSAGPHSLLLSIRRNQSMECFDTPFEIVNRLEFVSEWDYQTVSTLFCFETVQIFTYLSNMLQTQIAKRKRF